MATAATTAASGETRARRMVASAYGGPALSRRFRLKRFSRVTALIDKVIAAKGRCRIADIGGTKYYWDMVADFVAARPVEISLINPNETAASSGKFAHLAGDATDLVELDDMSFDLAHSNSVIEHVGDWTKMRAMAANMRRLAPAYYLQTPYFWFPVEPHFRAPFFHFLPEQVRRLLVMKFALGFSDAKATVDDAMARVQSARLLDAAQLGALLPDAAIFRERVLGLTKSLIAVRE